MGVALGAENVVVVTALLLLLVAAALVFLFRRVFVLTDWKAGAKAIFSVLTDFLKSVSSTLVGIALVGYILQQVDGQRFDFADQGVKLLVAATVMLLTALFIAATTVDEDDSN